MRFLTFSALLLTASAVHYTPPAYSASLETMLTRLNEHPRVQAARKDLGTATAAQEEAFSGYLPKVDLFAAIGPEEVDRTGLAPAGSRTNENATSYSASITQPVFRGFGTEAAVNSADINTSIAQLGVDATYEQILFEGASSYLEVLRFVELTELALDNQDTLRQQLNLEDERVKRGSGIAVDALQAKSRLQVSKERYTAFVGGLKDAISRYTQVFNSTPELDAMRQPDVPAQLVPDTLEEAISIAVSNNPTLQSSEAQIALANEARTTAKTGYYPSVDLVARHSRDDDVSGVFGEEERSALKLESSWQIFSGFADRSRIKQADHRYSAAMETAQFTQRQIVQEVKLAWSALTTSRERMELLDNAVNIAGEVYDARTRLRDAGSETAINVLDAENELYSARIDAASARYDYFSAIYRLLLATGQIDQIAMGNPVSEAAASPT